MSGDEKTAAITVIQAVYGSVQRTEDVTRRVQALADKGQDFAANNNTLGGDPSPGHDKHFAMNYTVGSSRFAFACEENQTVSLRMREVRRGPITVIAAA